MVADITSHFFPSFLLPHDLLLQPLPQLLDVLREFHVRLDQALHLPSQLETQAAHDVPPKLKHLRLLLQSLQRTLLECLLLQPQTAVLQVLLISLLFDVDEDSLDVDSEERDELYVIERLVAEIDEPVEVEEGVLSLVCLDDVLEHLVVGYPLDEDDLELHIPVAAVGECGVQVTDP